jgi:cell division protein FtsI (penicillin-binding protein 3)
MTGRGPAGPGGPAGPAGGKARRPGGPAPRRAGGAPGARATGPDRRLPPDPRDPRNAGTPRGRGPTASPPASRPPRPAPSSSSPRPSRPSPPRRPPRRPPRPPRWLTARRGDPGRRLGVTLLAIAIVLTLFAGRLVQIQGIEAGYYKKEANTEKHVGHVLPAMRGTIYGSNGQPLAMTVEQWQIVADPGQMKAAQKLQAAQQLAAPLGLTEPALLGKLQHPSSPDYDVLGNEISAANETQIANLAAKLNLDGAITETMSYVRDYPDGEATANVVGFTNTSVNTGVIAGQAGIEEEYNKKLTGTNGSEQFEKGADGEVIPGTAEETPAKNGESIELTINPVLQYDAMKACENEVDKSQAKSCTDVIIQPQTGDILAMAQWPTWDQANPGNATDLPVQDVFTPGSTAKVITASAAFEHGGKTPMSSYYIPYAIYRGGQLIHDAEDDAGAHYTIAGIIANSSNIGMSEVDASVPPQTQYDYLRNFGLDELTGLGLPGESPGLLSPPSKWAGDERYTLAYGQGIAVNAVQMASVYATIANGGVRVAPRLIAGTYNSAGQYTPAPPSPSRRVIQAKTAKELISILQQVPGVDETAAQPWGIIPGYAVAAKTGTANESPNQPGESCPASNPICIYGASYIGMAPGNGPKVVVAVNVQDPNKSDQDYFGDMVAGPVFYNVMNNVLADLQIQPQPGLKPPDVRLNAP